MKATVKLATYEVAYAEITAAQVESAGLTEKLFEFSIGKLIAHKGNPRVWETAAQSALGKSGAEVRKAIALVDSKSAEDTTEAQLRAAYAIELGVSDAQFGKLADALVDAAAKVDLIALIRAERVSTKKVDPLLAQAREIVADDARFAALQQHARSASLKVKIERNEKAVHATLFALANLFDAPFAG